LVNVSNFIQDFNVLPGKIAERVTQERRAMALYIRFGQNL
jgi:hypothetical protein